MSSNIKKYKSKSKKQQQQERNELAHIQRQMTDRRFPSSSKMTITQRLDRLEICTAQTLAVIDKFMVYFEERHCPFVDNNDEHLPEPNKPQQAAATESGKPELDNSHHSPYH